MTETTALAKREEMPAHLQKLASQVSYSAEDIQLPRAKVNGSGADGFKITMGDETRPVSEPIEVILIASWRHRFYYRDAYDPSAKQKPDCSSANGITPDSSIERPQANACENCPRNEWKERPGKDRQGKDCSERLGLLLMRPGKRLPFHLDLPPTVFVSWRSFQTTCANDNTPPTLCVWSFSVKDTGGGKKAVKFEFVRWLTEDEAKIREEIETQFLAAARNVNVTAGASEGTDETEIPRQSTQPDIPESDDELPWEKDEEK